MPSLVEAQKFNQAFCDAASTKSIPVAVFIGATAGIGLATVHAYAKYMDGRSHIIIMARTQSKATDLLNSLTKPKDTTVPVLREFVQCDVSLMKSIHKAVEYLKKDLGLTKVNYFVDTAGYGAIGAQRDDTEEGIDRQLATRYYSRFKLIHELLPLLLDASANNEDAKAMSVLGAGFPARGWVDVDDLGLKKRYTWSAPLVTGIYNDYMMEQFAILHPDVSFIHISAGFVDTKGKEFGKTSWFWKIVMWLVVNIVIAWAGKSPQDSAEYMLYGLFSAEKGLCLKDDLGNVIPTDKLKSEESVRRKIWEHSVEETRTDP